MPTKPKDAIGRPSITIHLKSEDLAEIDRLRQEAVGGIPGAKLSRGAFVEQVVLRHLQALKEPDSKVPRKKSAA